MILDTNALSALAEKDARVLRVIGQARRVTVTLISLGEFTFGIRLSSRRGELERWLEAFLKRVEVICPNRETINLYASVRTELRSAGTPTTANDCWIAALVRQHQLPILSLNQHFNLVGNVRRVGW